MVIFKILFYNIHSVSFTSSSLVVNNGLLLKEERRIVVSFAPFNYSLVSLIDIVFVLTYKQAVMIEGVSVVIEIVINIYYM